MVPATAYQGRVLLPLCTAWIIWSTNDYGLFVA